jgi:hypothetical protein
LKVAVTDLAAAIVTWQAPVPLQAPLHPAKTDPEAGEEVRVTTLPDMKVCEQSEPQLIPAGEEVTLPPPDLTT